MAARRTRKTPRDNKLRTGAKRKIMCLHTDGEEMSKHNLARRGRAFYEYGEESRNYITTEQSIAKKIRSE